jgi:hypothetical protein
MLSNACDQADFSKLCEERNLPALLNALDELDSSDSFAFDPAMESNPLPVAPSRAIEEKALALKASTLNTLQAEIELVCT